MAVFSSDQVNHVFVAVGNGSLVGAIPAVGAKNAQVGGAVKDAAGNDKYVGSVIFDEVTAVNEQTLADIKCPELTFTEPAITLATGETKVVEVVAKINGALCDDEGNEWVIVGTGEDLASAMADVALQVTGDRAEHSVAGQLIKTDGASKISLKPTTQDPTLGDIRVVPRLTGWCTAVKADANGVVSPLAKVEVAPATLADGADIWATKLQQAMAFEYFALGERADLYRNVGWPKARPSKCVLKEGDTVTKITTIEGYYAGDCEDIQRSKKMVSVIE